MKQLLGESTAGAEGITVCHPCVGGLDSTTDRQTGHVDAFSIKAANRKTLQRFVQNHAAPGATVYTDSASAYIGIGIRFHHEAVNHSRGEYVRGDAYTNGIESMWAMVKRGYRGTYHQWSKKHNDRYIAGFCSHQNMRDLDTADQLTKVVADIVEKRLTYQKFIA